jgi:hypothetical protein
MDPLHSGILATIEALDNDFATDRRAQIDYASLDAFRSAQLAKTYSTDTELQAQFPTAEAYAAYAKAVAAGRIRDSKAA